MWAELEQRLVVIKADKTLCAICGKKCPDPLKMRAHAFRRHREAFSANLRESGDKFGAEPPSWCLRCEECAIFTGSALKQDVHAQTERHKLQRQINLMRTIDNPAMNAQSLVNQQQLPHVPNSSSVAEYPVSDFLEPLIDGDEGTVDFALQAMIPEANVLHAQHYSQEQSVSSLSSPCAAPSYGRCLNRCYSCFREVTITSF